MKLDLCMESDPPRIGETVSCYLCRIVPPGKECGSCPLLSGDFCDLFDERTYRRRSPTCRKEIRHADTDS